MASTIRRCGIKSEKTPRELSPLPFLGNSLFRDSFIVSSLRPGSLSLSLLSRAVNRYVISRSFHSLHLSLRLLLISFSASSVWTSFSVYLPKTKARYISRKGREKRKETPRADDLPPFGERNSALFSMLLAFPLASDAPDLCLLGKYPAFSPLSADVRRARQTS